MLTEVRCDALDKEFHNVKFRQGLNIVLGTTRGSSALGKTIFLQLIEFCFGGESYMAVNSDMRKHIDDHIHTLVSKHVCGNPKEIPASKAQHFFKQ